MKQLVVIERVCVMGHGLALVFGLAGLLLVLPHPSFILSLPEFGQTLFRWSMAGGGVVYIILGALAIALYAYRTVGLGKCLGFLVPSLLLSLGSELLGTSTGFPFGHYHYLEGLGYKIGGLVPFTIPLSWFYVGFVCYLLARAALDNRYGHRYGQGALNRWGVSVGAIALGAVLLVSWDLVLDPAMSQAPFPFWAFDDVGEFFGMPYRNLAGWVGTGAIFMTVASILWRDPLPTLSRGQLGVPLAVYLVNFSFGAIITLTQLDRGFWIPTLLGVLLGLVPAIALWWFAEPEDTYTLKPGAARNV